MDKKTIMLGMVFGSTLGGWLPTLWGAGIFSFSSVLGGCVGGALGIWLAFKLLNN
jgi:hypothetical protein